MSNFLIGNCSICKLERQLPILRDEVLICSECNRQIEQDLANFRTVECEVCFNQFSPIFVKEVFGQMRCKNCQPAGLCGYCHQDKALPYFGSVDEFTIFICLECKELDKF